MKTSSIVMHWWNSGKERNGVSCVWRGPGVQYPSWGKFISSQKQCQRQMCRAETENPVGSETSMRNDPEDPATPLANSTGRCFVVGTGFLTKLEWSLKHSLIMCEETWNNATDVGGEANRSSGLNVSSNSHMPSVRTFHVSSNSYFKATPAMEFHQYTILRVLFE